MLPSRLGPRSRRVVSWLRRRAPRLLGAAVAALLAVQATTLAGIATGRVRWPDRAYVEARRARITAPGPIDVLLLGDSTLHTTIDDASWSRALGLHVVEAPLDGHYGYAGSYAFLRQALELHHPRTVVIMQSLDMMTRRPAYDAILHTAEQVGDLRSVPPWRLAVLLADPRAAWSVVESLFTPVPPIATPSETRQPPRGPRTRPMEIAHLTPDRIRTDKLIYLRRIAALCRREQVRCLYAHGPYVDPACHDARPYLDAVDRAITRSGLEVVPGTPLCMPADRVGRAADHPAPRFRGAYSAAYRAAVARAANLRPPSRRPGLAS